MKSFKDIHPLTALLFLVTVIYCSMVFMHPVLVCINILCSTLTCIFLCRKEFFALFRYLIYMSVLIIIFNPIVNTTGKTLLFTFLSRKITLEAVIYGLILRGIMVSGINWFTVLGKIITTDKFDYLFSRRFPSLCTIFTMTIGMIPLFQNKLYEITWVRKSLKGDENKLKGAIDDLNAAVNFAFEKAVNLSKTMKNRGFGSSKPTRYRRYMFSASDAAVYAILAVSIYCIHSAIYDRSINVRIIPRLQITPFTSGDILYLLIYILFLLTPLFLHFIEEIRWNYLRSKI